MYITNDIISLDCMKRSHVFLIQDDTKKWTMIDTGFPIKLPIIIEELKKYNIGADDIKQIILTHGDIDLICNLKRIRL
jgi:glyoxylase-like metal-dependent hydrolase (beta-lactamase superfamily II)